MALADAKDISTPHRSAPNLRTRLLTRVRALLTGEHSSMRRMAGTAFAIRVASAAVVFLSQILLARWMGSFEFGIYVYVTTWVLLLGPALDLGLGTAAQRFIPEYRNRGMFDLLRGFIYGSRVAAFGSAIVSWGTGPGRSSRTTSPRPGRGGPVQAPGRGADRRQPAGSLRRRRGRRRLRRTAPGPPQELGAWAASYGE